MITFNNHKLVSLLQIMEDWNASKILKLMHDILAAGFFGTDDNQPLNQNLKNPLLRDMKSLQEECEKLRLTVSIHHTKEAVSLLEKSSFHGETGMIARYVNLISDTLRIELSSRKFISLPIDKIKYYESIEPHFGSEVDAKYPGILFDLDEASKSFALARYTACVFHLMRTMEIAIKAIAKCLGIPDPVKPAEKNWAIILRKIKDEVDKKNSTPSLWNNQDRSFFEAVYASLDAVKTAWRNPTMHVENKYTEEEAEAIFMAVKALMKKIAARMDENGTPLA